MEAALHALIAGLHGASRRCVLSVTGGGAGAAAALLSVPGGSRSILEVVVPYDEQALCDFLGHRPASYCSEQTASSMARRALERARWLAAGEAVVGVGCTASLRSDRPKRGDHRFHLAVQTAGHVLTSSLTLAKGARDREAEEAVLDRVLLNAMAESFGLAERVEGGLLPGEEVVRGVQSSEDILSALLGGRLSAVCVEGDGRWRDDGPRPAVLLPGSFNPAHRGHWALGEAATRRAGAVAFELSVVNADKPPLSAEEVRQRAAQFAWSVPLWLTRAPTFAEKAELFPGAVFIIGADTAERVVQPRFYGGDEAGLARALDLFRARGCRFLVAGRLGAGGTFVALDDLAIPVAYRDLFSAIPAADFRVDLSSTELRKTTQRAEDESHET
jgi:nicotinic acid mononucleotide adenylyltransferase/nicotinamide mononucleotide (NMN) deamidase PncC